MFRCEKYVLDSVRNDIDSSSYLLNVFKSIDTYAGENWAACARFLIHLRWHKPRGTILSQKINKDPWNKGDFGPHKEGTQQARETLEIYRQLGTTVEQAKLLDNLAWLLHKDVRVDAAKDAASHWQSVSSRRRVGILRPPSQSRLLSDGTRSCSGFITPLRSAFSTNASLQCPDSHRTSQVTRNPEHMEYGPRDAAAGSRLVSTTQTQRGQARGFACFQGF